MTNKFTENTVEEAVLEWMSDLQYSVLSGPEIAPGEAAAERNGFDEVVLVGRLREAIERLNPNIPDGAREDALRRVLRTETPNLHENNRLFHRMLVDGIDVEFQRDRRTVHDKVWLVDFADPENNDWLAVNQFSITEGKHTRRPDVILFVNGLPLVVIELKNAADKNATTRKAFDQLQTYKLQLPTLMTYNVGLVASDGITARIGTLTAGWDRFMPWRTIEGKEIASKGKPELDVLIKGVFDKQRFLDVVHNFIVFEVDGGTVIKKMAGYHQFHAVNKAVECTLKAISPEGDRRVGVVWHTQGSGKSLTMTFYAGKIVRHPAMENPTLVVITDRNDLDDQLHGTFSACHDLLRQKPAQANNRDDVRELLQVASGGVVFTTLQKFAPDPGTSYPKLSDRRNIVVIADEAHRSQYGHYAKAKQTGEISYGFTKHLRDALPNASYLGFTGTPIELGDKNTKAVFGDYIDVYDISRAVEDGATVRIFYEGRLAKLELSEDERPKIDSEFEDITEGEEDSAKEKLKTKWAALEALVGSERRIKLIARDLVEHWEQRQASMDGKAMIVCMSRRICVELYKELIALRPDWHSENDDDGVLKVVMTGAASDPIEWQQHIRPKRGREALAKRFKKTDDPMKLVIVRDMWLTGFDAPCMHTMYVDKPMGGHNLMQAIARVNRVFHGKPGGLVVDYLGLATELKKALAQYTQADQEGTGIPIEQALDVLLEKYEIVQGILHGFDYSKFFNGTASERIAVIPEAMDFILQQEKGQQRFTQAVTELSKAFALVATHDDAVAIREEIAFFQCLRAQFGKLESNGDDGNASRQDLDAAVRQILSKSVASNEVIDIFSAAGMDRPDISILSDEFLAEVRDMPQRNLALEVLRKLLSDEIKTRSRKNLAQSRLFSEMLEKTIKKYQNRSIGAAQVIAELVEMAKEMREARRKGEALGLSEDEEAFYEALEVNDSAVSVLGDKVLCTIARDLVDGVRNSVTIDWTVKESVRAKLRVMVKKILKKHGYPPDKAPKAIETVLKQAELLCVDWAAC
ncbi:type I restriction endonuclease subunit R [Rubinisphaera sp. JC750]|uniref:type I restriction endonuclease subunit R n=1 Tax=Rubinisphaera sp. JC750 TaxID=2898658 RepID=UPI001F1D2099|nr:type I restriction endonuclease subunit R [Rubinisphaera sp. JC750]